MGLEPLEFADCLIDSPDFREKLYVHEKELERMSKAIKMLIADGKELLTAAQNLARTQSNFSKTLASFNLDCIGSQKTDNEVIAADALQKFSQLIARIEEERNRMLAHATEQFLKPLDRFRKQHIGCVKEGKKKFDKQTAKFCQSLEQYLNLKTKINDNTLQEADAALELERRGFYKESMNYVLILQEVQERKKFEFVEIIMSFVYSWLTFYHEGHEVAKDYKDYMTDLQLVLQNTRKSFESTREEAQKLMMKMLEVRGSASREVEKKPMNQFGTFRGCTREGYLYLMEKKALGTTWIKHYCFYKKEPKEFLITPYNQVNGKLTQPNPEMLIITSCVRRASDSIEKRFCFDITVTERSSTITVQALSEEDRKLWMDAMDGKEPIYYPPKKSIEDTLLDDIGFKFINKCLQALESRGLKDQGLYRMVGVNSKVQKLLSMGLDRRKLDKLDLNEPGQFEVKTITSAVKNYLRSLPEPMLTFRLHSKFIAAAKQELKTLRIYHVHTLVHKLPEPNFEMLDILMCHLKSVSDKCDTNLMTVTNLGVCFGPTLMRPEQETVAAIMDIKFCNIIVEILVAHHKKIFKTVPEGADKMQVESGRNHTSLHSSSLNPVYVSMKSKLKPVDKQVYNPATGIVQSSKSSSSDSLNLNQSSQPTPNRLSSLSQMEQSKGYAHPKHEKVDALVSKFHMNMGGPNIPTFGSTKRRTLIESTPIMTTSAPSLTGSLAGNIRRSSNSGSMPQRRTARTLYHCIGENESELSFEPNEIVHEVRTSHEPGWLEGNLKGVFGLIPETYLEFLD